MASSTKTDLLKLKKELTRITDAIDGSKVTDEMCEIVSETLTRLKSFVVSVDELTSTQVGKTVNNVRIVFKNYGEVTALCKSVTEKWKTTVLEHRQQVKDNLRKRKEDAPDSLDEEGMQDSPLSTKRMRYGSDSNGISVTYPISQDRTSFASLEKGYTSKSLPYYRSLSTKTKGKEPVVKEEPTSDDENDKRSRLSKIGEISKEPSPSDPSLNTGNASVVTSIPMLPIASIKEEPPESASNTSQLDKSSLPTKVVSSEIMNQSNALSGNHARKTSHSGENQVHEKNLSEKGSSSDITCDHNIINSDVRIRLVDLSSQSNAVNQTMAEPSSDSSHKSPRDKTSTPKHKQFIWNRAKLSEDDIISDVGPSSSGGRVSSEVILIDENREQDKETSEPLQTESNSMEEPRERENETQVKESTNNNHSQENTDDHTCASSSNGSSAAVDTLNDGIEGSKGNEKRQRALLSCILEVRNVVGNAVSSINIMETKCTAMKAALHTAQNQLNRLQQLCFGSQRVPSILINQDATKTFPQVRTAKQKKKRFTRLNKKNRSQKRRTRCDRNVPSNPACPSSTKKGNSKASSTSTLVKGPKKRQSTTCTTRANIPSSSITSQENHERRESYDDVRIDDSQPLTFDKVEEQIIPSSTPSSSVIYEASKVPVSGRVPVLKGITVKEEEHQATRHSDSEDMLCFTQAIDDMEVSHDLTHGRAEILRDQKQKYRRSWNSVCKKESGIHYSSLAKNGGTGALKAIHKRDVARDAIKHVLEKQRKERLASSNVTGS